jgi:hypothetical protein
MIQKIVRDTIVNMVSWIIIAKDYECKLPSNVWQGSERADLFRLSLNDFDESFRKDVERVFFFFKEQKAAQHYNSVVDGSSIICDFDIQMVKKIALENLDHTYEVEALISFLTQWNKGVGYGGISHMLTMTFGAFNTKEHKSYDLLKQRFVDLGILVGDTSKRIGKHFMDLGVGTPSQYMRELLDINTAPSVLYLTYPNGCKFGDLPGAGKI